MFKKLKDKLTEEVKQSPARLQASMQQLAQAVVSPALSNSSIQELSTSNDNFSLTEEGDETPKNSPAKHGFQKMDLVSPTSNSMGISRRSSVSSITSDTSSLFATYETPPNLYQLQSDIDQSASEVDENISPQLEKVTKDQLYSAYRKVQAKYHKYRGRYTDLAAHYRELHMARDKLESVLVQAQDKVLRRVADLKEQCQLEQQAKAHLEEALRNDIEEKDHIINTLNTKIKLLQTNGPTIDTTAAQTSDQKQNLNLIDLTTETTNNSNESTLATENAQLKDKLKKLENLVLKYKDSLKRNKEKFTEVMAEKTALESEYETYKTSSAEKLKTVEEELATARTKVENLTDQMNVLKKREEESAISLAENKLSIHRELEDKEEQIKQLRLDLKYMTDSKNSLGETIEKYKTEVEKLVLLQNSQNLDPEKKEIFRGKTEALKFMQQEMQQKLINMEERMGVKSHDEVDQNKEFSKKQEKLEKESIPENTAKLDDTVSIPNLRTDVAENDAVLEETRAKLKQLQNLLEEYKCDKEALQLELSKYMAQYNELKNEQDAEKITVEEKNREAAMTIEKLQATVQSLDKELENMRGALMDRDKVCESFNTKVQEYAVMLEKVKENLITQKQQDNTEISLLQKELESRTAELLEVHSELNSCRSTISDLTQKLQANSTKTDILSKQRNSLIKHILNYKNSIEVLKEDCRFIKNNVKEQYLEYGNRITTLNKILVKSLTHLKDNDIKQSEDLNDVDELKRKYSEMEMELANAIRLKSNLESDVKKYYEQLKELSVKLEERDEVDTKNCKLIAEIDNLNFKLYDLQKLPNEVKELKEQLKCKSSINEELSNQISNLQKQLEEANGFVKAAEELGEKYAKAMETLSVLQSENLTYNNLGQEADSLRSKVQQLQTDINKKNEEITKLNETINAGEIHIADLKSDIESKRAENEKHLRNIENLKIEKETLSEQHERRIAELSDCSKKAMNENLAQLKENQVAKEKQHKLIKELNNKINELKAKNEELNLQLKITREEIEALKTENSEFALLKESNSTIGLELEKLRSINEDITLENKNLKDKQNELFKCKEEFRESNEVLKGKIADYESTNERLLENIQHLHSNIESCKNELTLRNESIHELQNQVTTIDAELQLKNTKIKEQAEELKKCINEAEETKRNLSNQIEELSNEVSCLNLELEESNSIKEKNSRLLLDLEAMEKELMELRGMEEENANLNLKLNDLSKVTLNLEEVQLKNKELVDEVTSLKNKIIELETVHSENVKLQAHVNTLESKISNFKAIEEENTMLKSELNDVKLKKNSQNEELQSRLQSLTTENEKLVSECEESKHMVDEKVAELKLLDTRNSDLLNEVERLNSLYLTAEEKLKEMELLKTTIKSLEEKRTKLQSDVESLRESNANLQEEIRNAYSSKTTDESLIKRTDKLQEENKKLEAQLDEALITFQAKESQMQMVNDELKSHVEKLREQLKTSEEEQSMRLKQLVKEFQAQLHDKEEELQAALEKRFDRQQNYESNLIQQYKEQLKDFQIELTAKSEQIENLILENKELTEQRTKDINQLNEKIATIKKEHIDEIRDTEKKWKAIVQQRTDKLEAKHEEEINELTKEWRNERKPGVENDTHTEELESTSRVAMAVVQSNTGSFHTLQQTLTAQRRELTELRKLVKLRHDTLEDSTEIEYLRNILFEYMMGRETMVLARVIAAVVKFDQEQTAKILKKEEDKMTLLGQLGLT